MSMPLVKNILKSKSYSISKIYSVVTLNTISSVVISETLPSRREIVVGAKL
jgi:hypothetical protein